MKSSQAKSLNPKMLLRVRTGKKAAWEKIPWKHPYRDPFQWCFPKVRGTFSGPPIIRTVVFWSLHGGPPSWEISNVQASTLRTFMPKNGNSNGKDT